MCIWVALRLQLPLPVYGLQDAMANELWQAALADGEATPEAERAAAAADEPDWQGRRGDPLLETDDAALLTGSD